MNAPTFRLIGTAPAVTELVIGFRDAAVRRVCTVKGTAAATLKRGLILVRGADGKFGALKAADIDATATGFPSGVLAVLEQDVVVPAGGELPAQTVVRGEVAADLLLLEASAWGAVSEVNRVKLENLLTASGIVPGVVVR